MIKQRLIILITQCKRRLISKHKNIKYEKQQKTGIITKELDVCCMYTKQKS